MRVVMVDTACQTPFYDYPLGEALQNAGCQVELITAPFLYAPLPPTHLPVRIEFGRVARLRFFRRWQRLRQVARGIEYPLDWLATLRLIRLARAQIVHVQWAMLPLIDAVAFRSIRASGARLVYTVHDIQPHWGALRRRLLSPAPLYPLPDALVVHTEANKAALIEATNISATKVHVIAQGNVTDWSARPVDRVQARSQLGIPFDSPVILFFGIIKPYKRLDLLLRVLPDILVKVPDARLLIVGRAAENFGRYQSIIDNLNLQAHVLTRLEYIPESEVPTYFAASNVVALPYTDADFSGVLLHTASFGRPIVATHTGGLHQMIDDGKTGYLVPSDDLRAFKEALTRVLLDPALAERMGSEARHRVLEQNDWRRSAQVTCRLYETLLTAET
jgi:glycosyltransferase involved in cell wall biosynthesis